MTISSKKLIAFYQKQKRHDRCLLGLMILLLLVLAALMLMLGNTFYPFSAILQALANGTSSTASFTILTLRLPRMLCAILCGAALGISGNTFQKLLGNPLASPDIIGITSGASFGAVFCIMILRWSGFAASLVALIAGIIVSCSIYLLSRGKGSSNGRMILIGIGIQAFLNALLSYLLLKGAQYDVASAMRWLSGSLNGVSMQQALILLIVIIITGAALAGLSRYLLILQLGDEFAISLGVRLHTIKLCMILCALVLNAFAVSISGPIASVAFLAGPIATRLMKEKGSSLLAAALIGALIVAGSDILAQNFLPARYPVGVITGILGAPYLLFLLIRLNRKGGMA